MRFRAGRLITALVVPVLLLGGCAQGGASPAGPTVSPMTAGMASISLDDGTSGHLAYAQPVLTRLQLPATFYLVSDALTYGSANLSAKQGTSLVAAGQEIGNHTKSHQDLTELPPDQMVTELAGSQATLVSRLGVTPLTCAYPYGSRNSAVLEEAKKLFKGCRTTDGGQNKVSEMDPYQLKTFIVDKKTKVTDVREALEQAKTQNAWIIFTFHGVDPTASSDMDVTPEVFTAHVQAIKESGIPVQTVGQALATVNP